MSSRKIELALNVRTNTPREGVQAFQAEVEPREVIAGEELYRRMAVFLNLGTDGYRAKMMVEGFEAFVRHELEQGNRLDFGLVSFFPKLSSSLPTRDADPGDVGVFVRGAVKARRALSASLENHLVAKNAIAGDPVWIGSVMNETRDVYDIVGKDDILSIAYAHVTIDPSRPDEGVWLEKPIKRRGQKHTLLSRAEVIDSDRSCIRCRFRELPPAGSYKLVIATRGDKDASYKLRYVRHPVRVV